jgi:predicted MFS family arabinose efflux permease
MRRWPDPRPYLAVVFIDAGDGIASTLVPLYLDTAGYPVAAIGVLVAVYGITSLISRLPSGLLYRRRRARRLMYFALALQAVSIALYPLPADPLLFGLVRAVHGFAVGMATTVNMALFMDMLSPGGNRHRHLAAYASALSAGYTVGGLAGGLLGYWLDYGPAFLCAAIFPLLAALCLTTPARSERPTPPAPLPTREGGESPGGARGTPLPGREGRDAEYSERRGRVRPARLRSVWDALRHPQVAVVSLVAFVLGLFHAMAQTFVPLYALNAGLNLAEIGIMRGAHSLANTVARPFCGELTRWLGYHRLATLGMVLLAGVLALTPFQNGLLGLTALFVAVGLCRAGVLVANTVSVADIQEGTVSRGLAVGVYSAARDLGSIVGPVAGGYLAAAVGLRAFFWVGPPLVLALYGLLLWLASRGPGAAEADARAGAAR